MRKVLYGNNSGTAKISQLLEYTGSMEYGNDYFRGGKRLILLRIIVDRIGQVLVVDARNWQELPLGCFAADRRTVWWWAPRFIVMLWNARQARHGALE